MKTRSHPIPVRRIDGKEKVKEIVSREVRQWPPVATRTCRSTSRKTADHPPLEPGSSTTISSMDTPHPIGLAFRSAGQRLAVKNSRERGFPRRTERGATSEQSIGVFAQAH